MRASKADWSPKELATVYRSQGFAVTEGAKHTMAQHRKFPRLIATISRSDPLPTGYIETLLDLVDEVARLEDEKR